MKNKALLLTLAAGLMLASTPLWADTSLPPNPCNDPGKQSDPIARHNYLTCLNEYVATQHKAIEVHNQAANQAMTIMREYQLAPREVGK
jgi:hypothetical protein